MKRQRIFGGALLALAGWASGQAQGQIQGQIQRQAQLELCEAVGTLTHNSDGSYFYSSDLRYGADTDGVTEWMKRLDETLRADGTLLVAVPTPTRGMVNGGIVTDRAALETLQIDFDAAAATAYYQDYVRSLAPLAAVDLVPWTRALAGRMPGFQQRYDRHWTPEGARTAAVAAAAALATDPRYAALTPPAPTKFTTTLVGTEPGENAIFELTEEKCGDLPDEVMETVNLYETREAGQGDLFASETPLVALAGTSFSTEPYNFDGFLSDALGQPVLNAAVSAGGLYTALQDLLLNREPGGNPRVIVWEYRLGDAVQANSEADFVPFRELIASVHGDCGADALVTNRAAVSGTNVELLTTSDPAVVGPDYYLRLQASDLSLVEFALTLTHADGSADVAPILRSTRVANTGEYYLELSRELTAPLERVSLTVPAGTTGTVDAQLCRAPGAGTLASRGP